MKRIALLTLGLSMLVHADAPVGAPVASKSPASAAAETRGLFTQKQKPVASTMSKTDERIIATVCIAATVLVVSPWLRHSLKRYFSKAKKSITRAFNYEASEVK